MKIDRGIGMQKISQARGLMAAIAKRFRITRFAVYQWPYPPRRRAKIVAEMSGLPIAELIRDKPAEWRAKVNGSKRRIKQRRTR